MENCEWHKSDVKKKLPKKENKKKSMLIF
jgi:hypothetical protein